MGLLTHLTALGHVAVLAAAASSYVTDPYVATQFNACPSKCDSANPGDWPVYHDLRILKSCDEPMLLNFAVNTPIGDPTRRPTVHACTTSSSTEVGNSKVQLISEPNTPQYEAKPSQAEVAWRGGEASQYSSDLETAAQIMQALFDSPLSLNTTIAFGYSNGVAVGAYVGSMLDHKKESGLVEVFLDKWRRGDLNATGTLMQICGDDRSAAYTIGVVSEASSNPDEALVAVQDAVAKWNSGSCVTGYHNTHTSPVSVSEVTVSSKSAKRDEHNRFARDTCRSIQVKSGDSCATLANRCGITPAQFTKFNPNPSLCSSITPGQHVCCSAGTPADYSKRDADLPEVTVSSESARSHGKRHVHNHFARATCRAIQVKSGDSCGALASRCGITPAQFTKFNPSSSLCSSLMPGQHVCCSAGTLPDYSPKPNADGTCATHTIQNGDSCGDIAASNSITVDDINNFNKKTWAWMGCNDLQVGGK